MMIVTLLRIEFVKLRGTLVPLLCAVAPALVAVVAAMIAIRRPAPGWPLLVNAFGLWCYLVLPMMVATLAALLAQVDHAPRAWDHLFALPIPRGTLIVAKALTLLVAIGGMTALLPVLCFVSGWTADAVTSSRLAADPFPWWKATRMVASAWTASGLMAIIQLWVALRFRNFVVPVALGLAGTFVVVAAMGAPASIALPWAMPLATLDLPGGHPRVALLAGGLGGLVLLPLMAGTLARRDF